jgi:hypothetical protein
VPRAVALPALLLLAPPPGLPLPLALPAGVGLPPPPPLPLALLEPLAVGRVPVGGEEAEARSRGVEVRGPLGLVLGVAASTGEGLAPAEGAGEVLSEGVGVAARVGAGLLLPLAVAVAEVVGWVGVGLPGALPVAAAQPVALPRAPVGEGVKDREGVLVWVAEGQEEGVSRGLLALPPALAVAAPSPGDWLLAADAEGWGEGLPGSALPLTVEEVDREALGVVLLDTVARGLAEVEGLALGQGLGEAPALPVAVPLGEPVARELWVEVGEGWLLLLAPPEAVMGVALVAGLRDTVGVPLTVTLTGGGAVLVPERVSVCVATGERVPPPPGLPLAHALAPPLPEALPLPPMLPLCTAVLLPLLLGLLLPLSPLPVALPLGVRALLLLAPHTTEAEAVPLAPGLPLAPPEAEGLPLALGLPLPPALTLGEAPALRLR